MYMYMYMYMYIDIDIDMRFVRVMRACVFYILSGQHIERSILFKIKLNKSCSLLRDACWSPPPSMLARTNVCLDLLLGGPNIEGGGDQRASPISV